jgi:SAM-dependent methyltransferase
MVQELSVSAQPSGSATQANVDLFDSTYSHFEAEVLARIRRKTFGEDFGQNAWTTADEYARWMDWLGVGGSSHVLEVASGSGGPAIFLAERSGAVVTGIDINSHGVDTAVHRAQSRGLAERVRFQQADANAPLPFGDHAFQAVVCVDSANHFSHRMRVLKEWSRVVEPGGKVLFTDPVVVTGPVTNEELSVRSSIGSFLFVAPGVNERLLDEAGFELVTQEDVTENEAAVSRRWYDARADDRDALVEFEGEERFVGLQQFFSVTHRLASERRLSRFVYVARKR